MAKFIVNFTSELLALIGTTIAFQVTDSINSAILRRYYNDEDGNSLIYDKNNSFGNNPIVISYLGTIPGVSGDDIYINNSSIRLGDGYLVNNPRNSGSCTLGYKKIEVEPDIPEQPEIPEPEPGVTYYNLTIQAILGSDGEDQIYFYPYAEGTELNPYEDIYNPSQWENIKNDYEGYQYVSGIDDLDTDIVMNDNYTFWIYYEKIPEAETQTMTMVIVNNCKGFKVTDSSGNKLMKGANSEGIVVGNDSVYTNQVKELTRDVITGEILTLTHYGYTTKNTSTDKRWYQFNGWYYIDNNNKKVNLGNKRTITFQVPPADSWKGAVYCEATKINSGTFDWDENKVTGYQFNLTANEWLRLVDYIEAKKNDGGGREYYKDQIKTDQNFTAQMFNAVAVELGLTVRGKGQIIKASYFDEIKKAANKMAIEDIWK